MMNENTRNYLLGAVALLTVVNTILIFTNDVGSSRVIETPAISANTALVESSNATPEARSFDMGQAQAAAQQNQAAAVEAAPVPAGPSTEMTFGAMEHSFGTIKQDTKNKHVFAFTNTGDSPLIIQNAKGSCGCTVPKYPKEPIAPGGRGEIEVEYSPGKQKGQQTKTVTITANTEPVQTILKISAQVEEV